MRWGERHISCMHFYINPATAPVRKGLLARMPSLNAFNVLILIQGRHNCGCLARRAALLRAVQFRPHSVSCASQPGASKKTAQTGMSHTLHRFLPACSQTTGIQRH